MSKENDEFAEIELKMYLRLPMFVKYLVIMWTLPPLKFNVIWMKKGYTT